MTASGITFAIALIVGIIFAVRTDHTGLAFFLLLLSFGYGWWRIAQVVRASREREAQQWESLDLPQQKRPPRR